MLFRSAHRKVTQNHITRPIHQPFYHPAESANITQTNDRTQKTGNDLELDQGNASSTPSAHFVGILTTDLDSVLLAFFE